MRRQQGLLLAMADQEPNDGTLEVAQVCNARRCLVHGFVLGGALAGILSRCRGGRTGYLDDDFFSGHLDVGPCLLCKALTKEFFVLGH